MTEGPQQPQLRRDPITSQWVILAAGRGKRPHAPGGAGAGGGQGGSCPFCEGRESETPPEISACRQGEGCDCPGWTIRVFPNKFPILANIPPEPGGSGDPPVQQMPAAGFHEVIVDSPEHAVTPWETGAGQVLAMLETYRERITALRGRGDIKYVHIIRNHGAGGAASLEHPHSQLFALPFIPAAVETELDGFASARPGEAACVLCDLLQEEERSGERVVDANADFVAFAPFASRLPYELWIVPRRHQQSFDGCDCLESMAELMTVVLNRYGERLDDPPFNYWIHTYPLQGESRPYHWHLELVPRLTIPGGLELGAGVWVNTVAPEAAAAAIRG